MRLLVITIVVLSTSLAYGKQNKQQRSYAHYKKLARKNNPEGMFKLAEAYHFGKGTEKDLKKAFYFYKKASATGHYISQFRMAKFYLKGPARKRNYIKAYAWVAASLSHAKKAPKKFRVEAQKMLGKLKMEMSILDMEKAGQYVRGIRKKVHKYSKTRRPQKNKRRENLS